VLELNLYGPLRVLVDGRLAIDEHFKRRKAKALLVLLYLERDRFMPRDELLERLWPGGDEPPGDSGRLKQAAHVLRHALEAEHSRRTGWRYIVEHDGSYVFNAQLPHTSDFDQVEHLWRLAAADRRRGDPDAALARYERAFVLRRASLLPEFRYEDWAVPVVLAEHEVYLEALDTAARLLSSRGEYSQAIELIKLARREDPLRESSVLLLMEALWRTDQPAAAIRTYAQFRDVLARSLQIEPDPKLAALNRTIRRGRAPGGGDHRLSAAS
jgi:LuxR family transcriptional regulator, maltose regulon positive regulatory protein